MIFKKIEVFGFKSFADKLEVDFSGGITCIVGPNGCGKSNVSDAVRWVLGEQSSKVLRGSQMQDVIFKGTEKRTGLGYCEVSLHFDNQFNTFPVDFSEVVISRKLYRSGESEYFINRKAVRLKDINNLMHDSGIDRDGLTIISQGQVAEIVTSKPESRRSIFEEAAGIAKFKSRKQEAERKLERTTADLTRVNDVLREIDRTLGPLLKQAEAAEKYVTLRERLKLLEVNAYIAQYDNAATDKERLQAELDKIDESLKAKQGEMSVAAEHISAAMDKIDEIDRQSEHLREQVLNLSVGLEREQNEKRLAQIHRLNELKVEQAQVLAKKRTIENIIESGEGYKHSIRKILEAKRNPNYKYSNELEEVIGVVAQELSVPQEYESAIEVALGASAQNIITHDEAGAAQLIDLLKHENWGRATFLPLTAARQRKGLSYQEADIINEYRCIIGIASDLVTYDELIRPVVNALLGRVVVIDELESAIEFAQETKYAFKVVTLDGDVIETRGSITGGSKNALNNHLWHTNQLTALEASLDDLNKRIASLSKEVDSAGERKAREAHLESVAKLDSAKEELGRSSHEKDKIRSSIEGFERSRNTLSKEISDLTQLYFRTEANLARIDVNIEAMQARIDEEYGMNYAACFEFKQDDFQLESALSEIYRLKRQISELGPVNVNAIEDSREQKKRFDEYSTQYNDLTAAKTDLEKVIGDLAAEMESKFRVDFEKINHNFGVVFKELFGGGHARLELVPVSLGEGKESKIDWLQSGIEIVAEPPGKKLSNLTLLSGGEKALTAIAILFAILKLRPMPFCLLDEIEAALDDSNVGRFANYLLKFSKETQFIVITHRKPTMELADNLYGVTMEEKGVSKLVSVKLEAWSRENPHTETEHIEEQEAIHA